MKIMGGMRMAMITTIVTIWLFWWSTVPANSSDVFVDIPDFQHNSTVKHLANYSLNDFNSAHNAGLTFRRVVLAQVKAVSSKEAIYYLHIEVLDSYNSTVVYETQILDKKGEYPLIQFFTPYLPPSPPYIPPPPPPYVPPPPPPPPPFI